MSDSFARSCATIRVVSTRTVNEPGTVIVIDPVPVVAVAGPTVAVSGMNVPALRRPHTIRIAAGIAMAATENPVAAAAISALDIAAAATGFSVAAIAIPAAIRIVCGLLSAGTFIPLTATVGPATATTGTGSITITVPGSLTVLVLTTRIVAHDRAKESDITFYGLQGSQIDTERLDRGPRTPGLKLIWLQKRRCTV